MITEIGIAAGDIWHYLEQHNGTGTLDEMVGSIGRSRELILMGLGWLAREGHITLGNETTQYRAWLNNR